jgi:hypothetical protein
VEDREVIVNRWVKALQEHDWAALEDLYHADAIQEFPQSGERVVGLANILSIVQNYPGAPSTELRRSSGTGDRFVMNGMMMPTRIRGLGDVWVVEASMDYEAAGVFEFVAVLDFRGDKIMHEVAYFAARSDPPEWRSQWVERTR